ncbi:MAG: glycosyltransferase family 4 protein [Candidatus Krumholzibacteriia bacterium]
MRRRRPVDPTERPITTRPKPRILHLGPIPPPIEGGISAYLEGLLRSHLATRFDLPTFDVRVARVYRRHRWLRALLTLRFVVGLLTLLRRRRPDLVHIHTSDFLGFWEKSLLAGPVRLHRIPFVMHLHGGSFDLFLKQLGQVRAGWASRVLAAATSVVIPAGSWRPLLERFVPSERLEVVPNAIHCSDFAPAPSRRSGQNVRMLFLGMVSARKGLDELLQALLELLRQGCRSFELDVVGDEEFHGELLRYRRLYHDAGLDDWVHFHGARIGPAKLHFLQRSQIFVLPSRSESFGIANLEAMACGLALISTRTGAIPEYLEDGVHALLVEPGDAVGLARALRRLLEDAALRERLGRAACERVRDYDWAQVAERLGAVYARVLGIVEADCDAGTGAARRTPSAPPRSEAGDGTV